MWNKPILTKREERDIHPIVSLSDCCLGEEGKRSIDWERRDRKVKRSMIYPLPGEGKIRKEGQMLQIVN